MIENLTGGNLVLIRTTGRRDAETNFGRRVNSMKLYLLYLRGTAVRGFGELSGSSPDPVVRIADILVEEDRSTVIFGCNTGEINEFY